jgi:hypothetical protein
VVAAAAAGFVAAVFDAVCFATGFFAALAVAGFARVAVRVVRVVDRLVVPRRGPVVAGGAEVDAWGVTEPRTGVTA